MDVFSENRNKVLEMVQDLIDHHSSPTFTGAGVPSRLKLNMKYVFGLGRKVRYVVQVHNIICHNIHCFQLFPLI